MKSFVLSLVFLLALGIAGSGQADAAIAPEAGDKGGRERAATYQDSGTHLQRMRVARATVNDSGDYGYRSGRQAEGKKVTHRKVTRKHVSKKRYAKKRYVKKGKSVRAAHYGKRKKYTKRSGTHRYVTRHGKKRIAIHVPRRSKAVARATGSELHGVASFYWQPQRVAAGGWFNPNAMTAAHKSLPFGTRVRVTHLGNGRTVDVKINDRGPYIPGRIIDLSKAAAGVIGMQGQGVARVKVTVLGR